MKINDISSLVPSTTYTVASAACQEQVARDLATPDPAADDSAIASFISVLHESTCPSGTKELM